MARVRIRALKQDEKVFLGKKLKDKTMSVRIYERYRIIAEAVSGYKPTEIADRVGCDRAIVYDWIRRFNDSGLDTFERPSNPNGRAPIVKSEQVTELIKIALSRPEELGLPFTQWSVSKLSAYCKERAMLPDITDEWVRRLLRREGLTPQRTRTWKSSPDPEFEVKKTASSTSTHRPPKTER
ncbi:MAG: helix-turn-helix domain-containing protein [bacterium]